MKRPGGATRAGGGQADASRARPASPTPAEPASSSPGSLSSSSQPLFIFPRGGPSAPCPGPPDPPPPPPGAPDAHRAPSPTHRQRGPSRHPPAPAIHVTRERQSPPRLRAGLPGVCAGGRGKTKGAWLEDGAGAELSVSGAKGRGGAKGTVGTRLLARGGPALQTASRWSPRPQSPCVVPWPPFARSPPSPAQ